MIKYFIFFFLAQSCSTSPGLTEFETRESFGPVLQRTVNKKRKNTYECDPYLSDREDSVFRPYAAVGASFVLEEEGVQVEPSMEHGCSP